MDGGGGGATRWRRRAEDCGGCRRLCGSAQKGYGNVYSRVDKCMRVCVSRCVIVEREKGSGVLTRGRRRATAPVVRAHVPLPITWGGLQQPQQNARSRERVGRAYVRHLRLSTVVLCAYYPNTQARRVHRCPSVRTHKGVLQGTVKRRRERISNNHRERRRTKCAGNNGIMKRYRRAVKGKRRTNTNALEGI